jgi:chromate transporter
MTLRQIFFSFFKIGLIGFGGGSAVAPLIHEEFVTKHKFITDDEFLEIVSIANMLPGPSMPQMASIIGFKKSKIWGAIVATVAIIFPMSIAFTIIMASLDRYVSTEYLNAVFSPVLAVVAAVLVSLSKRVYVSIHESINNFTILLIILVAFFNIYVLNIHPSILIVAMITVVYLSTKEEKANG